MRIIRGGGGNAEDEGIAESGGCVIYDSKRDMRGGENAD